MARNKSVILTPAEKKEAVTATKSQVKDLQAKIKEIEGRGKIAKRTYDSGLKDLQKQQREYTKAFEDAEKARAKEIAEITKVLGKAQENLDRLNPPKAQASPTELPATA